MWLKWSSAGHSQAPWGAPWAAWPFHPLFIDQTETKPGRDSAVWNKNYRCIPTTKTSTARPHHNSQREKIRHRAGKNHDRELFWVLWLVARALIRIYLDCWNWAGDPNCEAFLFSSTWRTGTPAGIHARIPTLRFTAWHLSLSSLMYTFYCHFIHIICWIYCIISQ